MGVVLSTLAASSSRVLAFAALTILAQAWSWPRGEELRKRLRGRSA